MQINFVDIHVPDIIFKISYLLWRINISSFRFCSKLFLKFNSNTYCTSYHLNVTMNYCMISEKHWHKKWNQCYSEIWNTYFQTPSPFLKFIRIGRFIYISEVQTDDMVKFLSGLVTMNRQECLKFHGMVCWWQDGNLPRLQKVVYKFRFCKGTLSLKEKHTLILSQWCFIF